MRLVCACEPPPVGSPPCPSLLPAEPGTARVPLLSSELRPPVNSLKAVGAAADLSPGALVLRSGIPVSSSPVSSSRVVIMKKDFSKVTLCVRGCGLAACDPAICLEQQCRTWHWYSEPESRSSGCSGFPNFNEVVAFGEAEIPRQECVPEAPSSWCKLW